MAKIEHMREVLAAPLTQADLDRRSAEGWRPVAVIWERLAGQGTAGVSANITEPVPYGLKISEDCLSLEEDVQEREALLVMLEMIIQDKPLSEIATALNDRGLETRHKTRWTPGSVFDMLPRIIDVGPRVFSSDEWVVRRGRLINAV